MIAMRKSTAMILSGLLLLFAAFGLAAVNFYDSARAGSRSQSVLSALQPAGNAGTGNSPGGTEATAVIASSGTGTPAGTAEPAFISDPTMTMPKQQVDGNDYIGVLSIPDLELELPIISNWNDQRLHTAPCRYSGSVYTKDIVICGHNYDSQFGKLWRLKTGTEVRFTDISGNEFCYTLAEIETVEATAITDMTSGNWDMTLFTCTSGGSARLAFRFRVISPEW